MAAIPRVLAFLLLLSSVQASLSFVRGVWDHLTTRFETHRLRSTLPLLLLPSSGLLRTRTKPTSAFPRARLCAS